MKAEAGALVARLAWYWASACETRWWPTCADAVRGEENAVLVESGLTEPRRGGGAAATAGRAVQRNPGYKQCKTDGGMWGAKEG